MKYTIDEKVFTEHFSEAQIEAYMKENNFTRLESMIYLWGFNNFNPTIYDFEEDLGRPMFRLLAKRLSKIFEVE